MKSINCTTILQICLLLIGGLLLTCSWRVNAQSSFSLIDIGSNNLADATSSLTIINGFSEGLELVGDRSYMAAFDNNLKVKKESPIIQNIIILDPPEILNGPPIQSVAESGSEFIFSVTADGTEPLSYQWLKDGNAIFGATGPTYVISTVDETDSGFYTVHVSNAIGSVESDPYLLFVYFNAPEILLEPVNQSLETGTKAIFTVVADGTAPLSYQWSKDGNAIFGATDSSYVIPSVDDADSGFYTVRVSNAAGAEDSSPVQLLLVSSASILDIQRLSNLNLLTVSSFLPERVIEIWRSPDLDQWDLVQNYSAPSGEAFSLGVADLDRQYFFRVVQSLPHSKTSGLPVARLDFEVSLDDNVTLSMAWIEPGTFLMGSPQTPYEDGRWNDEVEHQVTLSRGFWLGKYEVTQGEWESLMGSNPSYFKNAGTQAPVENISWADTQEFINKLNEQERNAGRLPIGYEYRLPTEAQWEYACRAGTRRATYCTEPWMILGSRNAPSLDPIAWYGGNSGVGYSGAWDISNFEETQYSYQKAGTHPVGEKEPNAWGLYDMLGNVFERCDDFLVNYPQNPVTDPIGASRLLKDRNVRGASWYDSVRRSRAAYRGTFPDNYRGADVGFRLALRPEQ